jgi:hypothetical protein
MVFGQKGGFWIKRWFLDKKVVLDIVGKTIFFQKLNVRNEGSNCGS